jgi:predicted peptidase
MQKKGGDSSACLPVPYRFMKGILTAAVLALSCTSMTPTAQTGFLNREIVTEGRAYRYVVYVPREFDRAKAWPVLLSLHGGGERGSDGIRQTQFGVGAAIRRNAERFPMIVVMPQAPPDERWLDGPARGAMAALERTISEFHGDRNRIYLTGLSMGGYGAYAVAYENPETFAAMAPVCGGVIAQPTAKSTRDLPAASGADDPYALVASRIKNIPIWIFHGAHDDIIPPTESRKMHAALRAVGAEVKYTELPDANHNAWDPAYETAELWEWMLAQRK